MLAGEGMQSKVPEPDTAKPDQDPYIQNTDPDMGPSVKLPSNLEQII
jgi:hypothetical protein